MEEQAEFVAGYVYEEQCGFGFYSYGPRLCVFVDDFICQTKLKMKSYHNKKRIPLRQWLLLPFFLMSSLVEAQVTVDVRIDSLELWVGEQTRITLDVSTDTKSKLIMPQLKAGDMLTPGVEVVEVAKADTQQLNEGARRLVSQSYIVTSFDSAL